MKILIIGGTRFTGPFIVKSLYEAGHEITVFHRGKNHMELPDGVKEILGDRKNLVSYREDFKKFAPDVILDMVALTEEDALTVMNIFTGMADRIITVSSHDVYLAFGIFNNIEHGPLEKMPLTEESPLRRNIYPYRGKITGLDNYDKIMVEKAVMSEQNLPGTIVRLPMVYGPGDGQHRVCEFLKEMDKGSVVIGRNRARWYLPRGYTENMAHAITLAVTDEKARGKIYNAGEEKNLSVMEWACKIAEAAQWEGEILETEDICDENNYEQDIIVSTEKIRRELGYREIVSLEEGLRRTVAWEREHQVIL